MTTNFNALSLQSTPNLQYESDVIYTLSNLVLTFTPLDTIIAGTKIKVRFFNFRKKTNVVGIHAGVVYP